ncbi:ABC-type transport auxiliary lipoprotein family protein [Enterovirga rhinocerotis]|uniref:ABC-type transport auxiliary lipoprotein family protein n=1 Tax=Enterovirga rhinocerotis TaxID=1339210 RepID=UPI001414F960|nr:ABC-type transport auxiliary lipoprotein family protein [Enterovirga rhinocerotis]
MRIPATGGRFGSRFRRSVPRVLVAALAMPIFVSACSSPPAPAFDLTAPASPSRRSALAGRQIVVPEPSTIGPLEAERIVAHDAANSISYISGAQWADRLPRLFQARLIQTFENGSSVRASRPGDGVVGDYQLNTNIRAFQLDASRSEAYVEVSLNLVDLKSGKLVSGRVVSRRVPVPDGRGATVAQGLDRALSGVLLDIVRWVGGGR